jgi:hypothetical protein
MTKERQGPLHAVEAQVDLAAAEIEDPFERVRV